jgi:hypothetical protein
MDPFQLLRGFQLLMHNLHMHYNEGGGEGRGEKRTNHWAGRSALSLYTKYAYIKSTTVYVPSSELDWDSPIPSLASEPVRHSLEHPYPDATFFCNPDFALLENHVQHLRR